MALIFNSQGGNKPNKGTAKPAKPAGSNFSKPSKPSNTSKPSSGSSSGAGAARPAGSINSTRPTRPSTSSSSSSSSASTSKPSSGSGGGGGSSSSSTVTQPVQPQPDYRQDLLDYFKKKNEEARQSAIDAINQRTSTQEGIYNTKIGELDDQYQALRNQSEVEKYKARSAMREALANRGQLDSGYGRQENLILNSKFGNAINSINLQEQQEKTNYRNLIEQLKAEAAADINSINNQYNQALTQYASQLGLKA